MNSYIILFQESPIIMQNTVVNAFKISSKFLVGGVPNSALDTTWPFASKYTF